MCLFSVMYFDMDKVYYLKFLKKRISLSWFTQNKKEKYKKISAYETNGFIYKDDYNISM